MAENNTHVSGSADPTNSNETSDSSSDGYPGGYSIEDEGKNWSDFDWPEANPEDSVSPDLAFVEELRHILFYRNVLINSIHRHRQETGRSPPAPLSAPSRKPHPFLENWIRLAVFYDKQAEMDLMEYEKKTNDLDVYTLDSIYTVCMNQVSVEKEFVYDDIAAAKYSPEYNNTLLTPKTRKNIWKINYNSATIREEACLEASENENDPNVASAMVEEALKLSHERAYLLARMIEENDKILEEFDERDRLLAEEELADFIRHGEEYARRWGFD